MSTDPTGVSRTKKGARGSEFEVKKKKTQYGDSRSMNDHCDKV